MSAPALARNIFKTSRLAEFCSRKELTNQTGHSAEEWPLVLLKELLAPCRWPPASRCHRQVRATGGHPSRIYPIWAHP
jgi:hypothetical protein